MRAFAALDPEVASASGAAPISEARLMLNAVRQYFVLGVTPADVSRLVKDVKALPADLQLAWTEVLKLRLGRTDLASFSHGANTDCRLPQQTTRDIPQVVSSNGASGCSSCGSVHYPWGTLFSSPMANSCARQQSMNVIVAGTTRAKVYSDSFAPIAHVSRNCVIVDRYAGARLVRRGDRSGIAWFGDQLARDGVERILLVTASTGSADDDIASAVDALSSGRLKNALRVEARPDTLFRDSAHDRFIMLQAGRTGCTFSIGKGIEAFERNAVSQDTSFSSSDGATVARTLQRLGVAAGPHLV